MRGRQTRASLINVNIRGRKSVRYQVLLKKADAVKEKLHVLNLIHRSKYAFKHAVNRPGCSRGIHMHRVRTDNLTSTGDDRHLIELEITVR